MMRTKGLIITLLVLLCAAVAGRANAAPGAGAPQMGAAEAVHLPQWRDIGMCDVLAAPTWSSLARPATGRTAHDTPQAATAMHQRARAPHTARLLALRVRSVHAAGVCIYRLRCLRL